MTRGADKPRGSLGRIGPGAAAQGVVPAVARDPVVAGPADPKRFHPYGDKWVAVRAGDIRMASNTVDSVLKAFEELEERAKANPKREEF